MQFDTSKRVDEEMTTLLLYTMVELGKTLVPNAADFIFACRAVAAQVEAVDRALGGKRAAQIEEAIADITAQIPGLDAMAEKDVAEVRAAQAAAREEAGITTH